MADALAFAFTAALNPTLLAATMVMLFAAEPRRLMAGYLLGAYAASISIGLVIVFALQDSGAVRTTQHTLSPAADVVLGLLFVLTAVVVRSDRDAQRRERRARSRSEAREAPRWRRALDKGSPRTAFGVGVLLTLPGASYLVGMARISGANASTIATALAVVVFCVIMLLLIEIPLLGFLVAPDVTRRGVKRITDWVGSNARAIIARAAFVIGGVLLVRAAIEFLT